MKGNQEEPRLMAQWIVSLAVSVVCCAVLFIVFAGYIVELHDSLTLTTVRLEVAQERLAHVSNDLETLRRALIPSQPVQKSETQLYLPSPNDPTSAPMAEGQPNGDLNPVNTPDAPVPVLTPPTASPDSAKVSVPQQPAPQQKKP